MWIKGHVPPDWMRRKTMCSTLMTIWPSQRQTWTNLYTSHSVCVPLSPCVCVSCRRLPGSATCWWSMRRSSGRCLRWTWTLPSRPSCRTPGTASRSSRCSTTTSAWTVYSHSVDCHRIWRFVSTQLHTTINNTVQCSGVNEFIHWKLKMFLKQLSSRCSKNKNKMKKIIKLTVNTGQVMFSGEIYYYWHLNSVEKSLEKTLFFCA